MTEYTTLAPDTRLRLNPDYRLQWEPRQAAWVLLFPEGMVRLNESAGLILQECLGPATVAQVIGRLQARFPGEGVAADIIEFLEDAHAQHWLQCC